MNNVVATENLARLEAILAEEKGAEMRAHMSLVMRPNTKSVQAAYKRALKRVEAATKAVEEAKRSA
jgi:hypothetical protein